MFWFCISSLHKNRKTAENVVKLKHEQKKQIQHYKKSLKIKTYKVKQSVNASVTQGHSHDQWKMSKEITNQDMFMKTYTQIENTVQDFQAADEQFKSVVFFCTSH